MTRIKWSHLFIRFSTFISVAYMFKFSKEGCMLSFCSFEEFCSVWEEDRMFLQLNTLWFFIICFMSPLSGFINMMFTYM